MSRSFARLNVLQVFLLGLILLPQNGHSQSLADSDSEDYPTITADPKFVCNTVKFYDAQGEMIQGTRACKKTYNNCSTDLQTDCKTTAIFRSVNKSTLTASSIKTGQTIAGVAGTVVGESHSDCASDGAVGCITTNDYKAANAANITAGTIKDGVTIGGVTGDYPSATYPLPDASVTADLDDATFTAKIKSSASFEYWTSAGVRQTGVGDDDIVDANIAQTVDIFGTTGILDVSSPDCSSDGEQNCVTASRYKATDTSGYTSWDIRKGKTVAGVAGDLAFYNNMANTTLFDRSAGTGGSAGLDVFDTIDDYNNNGAFPTEAAGGWDQATGDNWIMDSANDNGNGGGGAGNDECDGTEDCVFMDRITNLMWSKTSAATANWEDSITYCEDLNYGGYTDWHLPTQKEWHQAYNNGIWILKGATKLNMTATVYWSGSTRAGLTTEAWSFYAFMGDDSPIAKTTTYRSLCVRS